MSEVKVWNVAVSKICFKGTDSRFGLLLMVTGILLCHSMDFSEEINIHFIPTLFDSARSNWEISTRYPWALEFVSAFISSILEH